MSSKKTSYPEDILHFYDALIKTAKGIERKGATMPYTSHNGHMFSFLDKDGHLGLRLAEEDRKEFLNKYKTVLCEAHGTVLKEYVLVPDKLFKKTSELKPHFALSIKYIKTLKPKPTKK